MVRGLILILIISVIIPCRVGGRTPEVPRDTSFTAWSTYVKVRKKHPEVALLHDSTPAGVRELRGVCYTTIKGSPYGKRLLRADVFRPDNDTIYPALIMVHGGGWSSGNKQLQIPMAQRIAAHGYVTVPVEYRLTPEAKYPAALHDIKTAIRWVRKNASKLGIDPDRIAISGCSAGAMLATLAGVTNESEQHEGKEEWGEYSSAVQAIVNIDGVATFVSESNIADSYASLAKKGVQPPNAQWLGGMPRDAQANWNEASALNWITSQSAPICFINSGLTRYSDGRDQLIEQYEQLGIHAEVHIHGIDVHPFWFFEPWATPTIDFTVDFLNRMFKHQ